MQALNQQFDSTFHELEYLDAPLLLPTPQLRRDQALSISPWDDSEASQGIIARFNNLSCTNKNHSENYTLDLPPNEHSYNFINSITKARKNRSDLGKLRKGLQQNKAQNYHLNLNKIEFPQYQKNQSLPFYQKTLFSNPKPNIKDFSSIQNNFSIKSYFFPNNIKITNKEESMSQETRSKKQYRKIKDAKGPSFIAIKSVDLKQKFPMENQEDHDTDSSVDVQTERFNSSFRTISTLGSRIQRKNRNMSIQETYSPSIHLNEQNRMYRTIDSTKESSEEVIEPVHKKETHNLDKKLLYRISQSSKNPVIVSKDNSNFSRKRDSVKSVKLDLSSSSKLEKMEDSNQTNETKSSKMPQTTSKKEKDMQVNCIKKQFAIKKEKASRISVLHQLKQKNDIEYIIQVLPPKGKETFAHNKSSPEEIQTSLKQLSPLKSQKYQSNQKSFHFGTRIRKQLNNSSLNKTLRIFNRMHVIEGKKSC